MKIKYIKIIILSMITFWSNYIFAVTFTSTINTHKDNNNTKINSTTIDVIDNNYVILNHEPILNKTKINNTNTLEKIKKRFKRDEQKHISSHIYTHIHNSIISKNTIYTNEMLVDRFLKNFTKKLETLGNLEKDINYSKDKYNQFINNEIVKLDDDIKNKSNKRLYTAISGAIASSSIPYINNKTFSVGLGIGSYKQYNVVSTGIQYKMNNNISFRVHMTLDNNSNIAIANGLVIKW